MTTPIDISNEIKNDQFMDQHTLMEMTKENLVGAIAKILKTERDLDFLLELRQRDLETLVACLRDWTDQEEK
jgi:hypothetical protein